MMFGEIVCWLCVSGAVAIFCGTLGLCPPVR
jgi:hypothetical protein